MMEQRLTAWILTLIVAWFGFSMAAEQRVENRYVKLIEKFDIGAGVAKAKPQSAAEFWTTVAAIDPTHRKFTGEITRSSREAREAINKVRLLPCFRADEQMGLCDSMATLGPRLGEWLGFDSTLCDVFLACHRLPKVVVTPSDRGFAVVATDRMVSDCRDLATGDTLSVRLACVLAHEYAHGLLHHHLQQEYARVCRRRSDALWDALLFTFAPYGWRIWAEQRAIRIEDERERAADFMLSTIDNLDCELENYAYDFCDEMVVQADIVAYRFIEWLGHGDAYVDFLRWQGGKGTPDARLLYGIEQESESWKFRIGLLEFMRDHPDLKAYERQQRRLRRNADDLYGR